MLHGYKQHFSSNLTGTGKLSVHVYCHLFNKKLSNDWLLSNNLSKKNCIWSTLAANGCKHWSVSSDGRRPLHPCRNTKEQWEKSLHHKSLFGCRDLSGFFFFSLNLLVGWKKLYMFTKLHSMTSTSRHGQGICSFHKLTRATAVQERVYKLLTR